MLVITGICNCYVFSVCCNLVAVRFVFLLSTKQLVGKTEFFCTSEVIDWDRRYQNDPIMFWAGQYTLRLLNAYRVLTMDVGTVHSYMPCVTECCLFCHVSEKRRGAVTEERWWPIAGWLYSMYGFILLILSVFNVIFSSVSRRTSTE